MMRMARRRAGVVARAAALFLSQDPQQPSKGFRDP